MVDFGESEKMIKITGKVDKSNTYNGFTGNISWFPKRENKILQFLVSTTRPKEFEGRGKKKKDDKENIVVHGARASFFHDQSH